MAVSVAVAKRMARVVLRAVVVSVAGKQYLPTMEDKGNNTNTLSGNGSCIG